MRTRILGITAPEVANRCAPYSEAWHDTKELLARGASINDGNATLYGCTGERASEAQKDLTHICVCVALCSPESVPSFQV